MQVTAASSTCRVTAHPLPAPPARPPRYRMPSGHIVGSPRCTPSMITAQRVTGPPRRLLRRHLRVAGLPPPPPGPSQLGALLAAFDFSGQEKGKRAGPFVFCKDGHHNLFCFLLLF